MNQVPAGRVAWLGPARHYDLSFARGCLSGYFQPGGGPTNGEEKRIIWQEFRPAMRELSFLHMSQRLSAPSAFRNLLDGRDRRGRVGNSSVAPPTATVRLGGLAKRYRRASAHRNLFQFSVCEKSQPLAVG